jgi:tetratricopeptide (TPR) repeat protein
LGGTPWQKSFTFDVGKARSANAFIPLLWASRRIDLLALRDDEASIRETVSLSKRFSIPSRYTSFIVLENQAMHREFNVAETDDRIEWTGEDEVEDEASDEAPVQEIAAPGGIGGGRGEELRMAAGAGGAADRSRAVMSGAPVSPPRSAPMPKASSEAGASKKRKAAEKPALGMVDDDLFGGGSIGYPRPCPRRYSYDVRVWRIPDRARDKDQAEAAALRAKIERDPLSRKLRRDLVRHLIRFGQYREALTEAARWLEMDSANPAAVTYAADMMRLGGNLFDALRMYSGVLDLKPEARGIMEMLAAYFESHGLWKEAYPFRVSLSLTRQADFNAAAAMAVAAERAGYGAEALAAAGALTTRNATGRIALAKGVRLKKALKDAVVAMVSEGRLPIPPGGAADAEARNAKLRIEARWNTSQNLDLWVSKRGEKFLGGSDSKARLVPGGSGTEGEVFYMATADPGKYTVQVVCAESGGCDGASGTLEIRVHGTRRTIPFDLPDGLGTDVAIITVERRRAACW